ncbi:DUF1559 family PulG-like putative transporter [Blastopirellula retiformator]|uniref:DUF1559 domain-containing protein n=1 Tax=Blastopirellula retiformator TaxID=2527970 RepID=A0A5C5V6H0_9BACT|nr:DUF1559 domain-containing protein [Blastopirellula retiformator]TWT33335.1 hypothetical protein Enr8_31610 [Blastopirellula retiformator]
MIPLSPRPYFVLLLLLALLHGGCSCSSDAERRMNAVSFSRSSDDEEEEETPPPKTPAPKPKAANPPKKPAAETKKPAPTTKQPATAEAMPAETTPAIDPKYAGRRERIERLAQNPPADKAAEAQAKLEIIGEALADMITDKGEIPGAVRKDSRGNTLLGWRIDLLPYLGYQDLYDQFALDKPWNDKQNLALAKKIPAVYQSPERRDEATNFLMAFGPTCAARASSPTSLETVGRRSLGTIPLVVEADDAMSVSWVKPFDLEFNPAAPREGMGQLRNGSIYVITADGETHLVPASVTPTEMTDFFVLANGFDIRKVGADSAATAPTNVAAAPTMPDPGQVAASTPVKMTPTRQAPAGDLGPALGSKESLGVQKLPIPDPKLTEIAETRIREIFSNEFRVADSDNRQAELAKMLVDSGKKLGDDPVQQFAMYSLAYQMAQKGKAPATAKDAFDALNSQFEFDTVNQQLQLLRFASQNVARIPPQRKEEFKQLAIQIWQVSYDRNNFKAIDELFTIIETFARSQNDGAMVQRIAALRDEVTEARKVYSDIEAQFLSLERPSFNPDGNLLVGRYLCLHRNQWDKGLPFLAKSSNQNLKDAALLELEIPTTPTLQAEIGDMWWKATSGFNPLEKKRIQRRAAQWYQTAIGGLPNNIERIKTQRNLEEFKKLYPNEKIPPLTANAETARR